jgi:EmrB/QacA subfamily drug resistance transporter
VTKTSAAAAGGRDQSPGPGVNPAGASSAGESPAGTQAHPEPQALDRRSLGFVVAALFVAMLLAALDATIFGTALPTIVGDLQGVEQMLWVTTSYILAATIMMPVYGKLGDLFGHKVLFFSGLTLFLGGSVLGGLAHNMPVLIAARGIQGLGGGGLMILSMAIIADIVPPRQRGTYMGIMGSAWAFASVLGPILGGWFADSIGWRWAFWFNLPLGVLAIVMAAVYLRMPVQKKARPKLDALGMVTMALATTAIVLVTSWGGREYAWGSPLILGLIGATVVIGALFVLVERRAVEPIIPLALFRDRNFNLTTIGGLLSSIAFFGVIIYMPTYLQMVTGLSATKSGLLLVPLSVGILSTSLSSGALASKTGRYKWMPLASMFVLGLSLYLLSTLTANTSLWLTCFYTFLTGVGVGLGLQILVLIVQNSFPVSQVGTATGAHSFFRQIGASLGSAAIGTLFAGRLMELLPGRLAALGTAPAGAVDPNSLTPALIAQLPEEVKSIVVSSYNDALAPVYLYIVPLMVVGFVLLLFIKEKPLATTNELPPEEPRVPQGAG